MKTNTEAKKEQSPKTTTTPAAASAFAKATADKPAPVPNGKAKTPKAKKDPALKVEAKADTESEPVDRLPSTVAELKESKSGLVTFLFLSGKDKDEIARELQATFKLAESQAVKIVRRITGRARFFRRAFDLLAAK
ncbi:MAG TPA: hypothetical protein PKM73_19775 [Verrucomicrobiota bacterium]|nr:hypothetical protein [Verrucomicrobiota bacterium]